MKTILHAEGFLKDSFCFYLSQTLHLLKYEFELSMNKLQIYFHRSLMHEV